MSFTSRVEEDYTVSPATTHTMTFAYDLRSRLIGEERVLEGSLDTTVYDISYTYDQVGNRLSKVEFADPNSVRTTEPARVGNPCHLPSATPHIRSTTTACCGMLRSWWPTVNENEIDRSRGP